jgi:hypothetical protein
MSFPGLGAVPGKGRVASHRKGAIIERGIFHVGSKELGFYAP